MECVRVLMSRDREALIELDAFLGPGAAMLPRRTREGLGGSPALGPAPGHKKVLGP